MVSGCIPDKGSRPVARRPDRSQHFSVLCLVDGDDRFRVELIDDVAVGRVEVGELDESERARVRPFLGEFFRWG